MKIKIENIGTQYPDEDDIITRNMEVRNEGDYTTINIESTELADGAIWLKKYQVDLLDALKLVLKANKG